MNPKLKAECAFCGKTNREVAALVSDGKVCICDECVEVSMELIFKEMRQRKKVSK